MKRISEWPESLRSRGLEEHETVSSSYSIVALGEVLWDEFPDGPRFGGAPANFACTCAELGRENTVKLMSAVGDDERGQAAAGELERHGVDITGLQVNQLPTGQVFVMVDQLGGANYRFAEHSAWDEILLSDYAVAELALCDAVCFGTLGQRMPRSSATIQALVAGAPTDSLRILDLNLRDPYTDTHVIRQSLRLCNVLKVNDEELEFLARKGFTAGAANQQLRQLCSEYGLRCMAVTRGANGALLTNGQEVFECPAPPTEVCDTVGAGDAFTAALTLGLLGGHEFPKILSDATRAAAWVCSQPGGSPHFPDA